MIKDSDVGIYKQKRQGYSERPPYFPAYIFEEYPFSDRRVDRANEAYASLRQVLILLGMDAENFGKKSWDPFGTFITPGQTVLLKPNFVKHFSERGGVKGLITHGSLIRVVIDYAYIALKGKGRIIIADGPMDDADFNKIVSLAGLYEIREFYKDKVNFDLEICDLRQEAVVKEGDEISQRFKLKGDPAGYKAVDLGKDSEFKKGNLDFKSFMGVECNPDIMLQHHNEAKNEYLIAGSFLNADVIINMPKMKTHKRAGVTLSLKNMVGVTGDRNWLPHFSEIVCLKDADISSNAALDRISDKIKHAIGLIKPLRDKLREIAGVTESTKLTGNWYGNDVIWRTIVDLAYIAAYANKDGVIKKERQRKIFVIVDGVIAGESDGPTNPTAKPCGVIAAGFNEFAVDMAATRLMGFDPMKIPLFKSISSNSLRKLCSFNIRDIRCVSNIAGWNKALSDIKGRCLGFKPHYGWKNHIEADNV